MVGYSEESKLNVLIIRLKNEPQINVLANKAYKINVYFLCDCPRKIG